jgi:hypothetical protein
MTQGRHPNTYFWINPQETSKESLQDSFEDPEHSAGVRKPKPSTEVEEFSKEKVSTIVTEEPDFEMSGEDTKMPQSSLPTFEVNLIIILRSLWKWCEY